MSETKNSNINEEDLKTAAQALGKKIAFLIVNLFPDPGEQREKMDLLPKLSPEQLMEFVDSLEKKYLETYGREAEDDFIKSIKDLKDDYEAKQAAADAKALEELDQLEKEIDSLNKKE